MLNLTGGALKRVPQSGVVPALSIIEHGRHHSPQPMSTNSWKKPAFHFGKILCLPFKRRRISTLDPMWFVVVFPSAHVGQIHTRRSTYISYTIRLISHSMDTSVILNQHILNNWHPCCNQTASLRTAHPCQLKTFPDWVLYFPWVTLFTDTTAQHLVRHLNPFWSTQQSLKQHCCQYFGKGTIV